MDEVVIREFSSEDLPRLLEIAVAAWEPVFASFRRILGDELFELIHPDWQEEKRNHIRSACSDAVSGSVLVAEKAGIIVGFVSYYPNAPRQGMAEIGNNAVHPDFKRQGIAHLMYEEVLRRLRGTGVRFVKVCTGGDPSHLPARRAYEKAGFHITLPGVEYFRRL